MYFCISANASFEIAEVFPNTLDDKNLEYVTIKNNYQESKSLSGYTLEDISGKQYIFGAEDILEAGERKSFFRTVTKIILNNTKETIFLYDGEYKLVDSVYYENSEKGEFLSFEDLSTDTTEQLISGEALMSDEVYIQDATGDKVLLTKIVTQLPQIKYDFQRPSYILKTSGVDIYDCDDSQDECKINFNFEESFIGDFSKSEYECFIDFGFGEITGQEERCNPNTVIFPVGIHRISVKIFPKKSPITFTEKIITINNLQSEKDTIESIDSTILSKNIDNSITAPNIKIEFQRPSYIIPSDDSSLFTCDDSIDECKANFNLDSSFGEGFKENDFYCEIDFGFGTITGEENKCNPNTVIFPVGNYDLEFKIFSKTHPEVFSTKKVTLMNSGYVPKFSISTSQSITGENKAFSVFTVVMKKIIVQSGVILDGFNVYKCKKEKCSMNLDYKTQEKYEKCFWDFGQGVASNDLTHTRCNPGLIKYGIGEFKGSLTVFEKGNDTNFKKIYFNVLNLESTRELKIKKEKEIKVVAQNFVITDPEFQDIGVEIELQGKLSKNKTLQDSTLICEGKDTCNVNLNGIITGSKKGLDYVWLLNNEIITTKLNPAGIWLELGEYTFKLQVSKDGKILQEAIFQVLVQNNSVSKGSKKKGLLDEVLFSSDNKKIKFLQRDMNGVILGDILPNPAGKDTLEFIQIQNTSSVYKNLEGCYISDGSKKYIFGSEILGAGEKKYFFKYQTKITLGNSKDTVELHCGENLLDSVTYERKIKDNELLSGAIFQGFTIGELKSLISNSELETVMSQYLKLKFLVLKRGGLKITGNTFPNSTLELYKNNTVFLTVRSDKNGKILLKTKSLAAGIYDFDMRVISSKNEYLLQNAGNFEITQAQRYSWFYKKPAKTKTSKLPKVSQFIVSQADAYDATTTEPVVVLPLRQKIALFIGMLSILLLLVLHIFSIIVPKYIQKSITDIFVLNYSTREKVLLVLHSA
ncbi:lamin tail domain-containing protein [Candidatus Gracilibacteria bacterium]|nr:lamin tail domain-containing protein [Candidatus Gracilibacteria bacterium]